MSMSSWAAYITPTRLRCVTDLVFQPAFAARSVTWNARRSIHSNESKFVLRPSTLYPPPILKLSEPVDPSAHRQRPDGPGGLSDQEWEIRTGRSIYILQQTLPSFFSTGLITSLDTSGGSEKGRNEEELSIYSPTVRLEYRPPTPFPAPFPRTLHVEGFPLYVASSVFVRHTLSALYTDLRVELQRIRVHGPGSSSALRSSDNGNCDSPLDPRHLPPDQARSLREKSLFVGFMVHGTNRVSKAQGGWQVNSTYTFSPTTGLIHLHIIDSIHPAPHQAFFSALQAALGKIGLGGTQGAGEGGIARTLPSSPSQSPRTGTPST